MRHLRRGYTLAELIIVIGILGLAGALLVPRLINADTFTVQAAVRSVIADITFAQTDALAMQKVRRVQFLRDENDRVHGYAILAPSNPDLYDGPFDAETAEYLDHPSAIATGGNFIVDFDLTANKGRWGSLLLFRFFIIVIDAGETDTLFIAILIVLPIRYELHFIVQIVPACTIFTETDTPSHRRNRHDRVTGSLLETNLPEIKLRLR